MPNRTRGNGERMGSIKTSGHEITLSGTEDAFWTSLSATQPEEGIDLIHIRMVAEEPASPPVFTLFWTHPIVDIQAYCRTAGDHDKSLPPEWIKGFMSKVTSQAPVCSLHSFSGRNRLTFAFSDALRATEIRVGVHEETAMLHCSIKLFLEPSPPLKVYEATLRLDTRDIPYYESLEQVQHGGPRSQAINRHVFLRPRGCRCIPPGTASTRDSSLHR